MNAGWLAAIAAVVTMATGWLAFMARLLWTIRGRWDETNATLGKLSDEITRLREQDNKIQTQIQSHLEWHERRPIGGHRGR